MLPTRVSAEDTFQIGRELIDSRGQKVICQDDCLDMESPWPDHVVTILSFEGNAMRIESAYIQDVLSRIVKNYPGVTYETNRMVLEAPYAPLFHYLEEIIDHVKNDPREDSRPQDLDALLKCVTKEVGTMYDTIRGSLKSGYIAFDHVWSLFRPGARLLAKDMSGFGVPQMYVCVGVRSKRGSYSGPKNHPVVDGQLLVWIVDVWSIVWDEAMRMFTRGRESIAINKFRGSRSIHLLEVYPLRFHAIDDDHDGERLCKQLEIRGREWRKLVVGKPAYKTYRGPAVRLEGEHSIPDGRKVKVSCREC